MIVVLLPEGYKRRNSTATKLDTAFIAVSALLITKANPSGISNTTNQFGKYENTILNKATELSFPASKATNARPNKPITNTTGTTNKAAMKNPERITLEDFAE